MAIVNKTFVKRYLAGRDPIGLQFSAGYPAPDPRNEVTVVGVVDDVRQKSVSDEAEPAFYSSTGQLPLRRQTMVVATSSADVASLQSAIRGEHAAIRSADGGRVRAGERTWWRARSAASSSA